MRSTLLGIIFWSGLLSSCGGDENTSPVCVNPAELTITDISDTSASINWISGDATSFIVEYKVSGSSTNEEIEITVESAMVILNALLPATAYEVRVRSLCVEDESAFSEILDFTTDGFACLAPSGFTFEVFDYNEVFVDWNETGNEVSWEVEYGVTGFVLGTGITKPANSSELLLDALIVGTTYDYYIKSFCEETESAYSEANTFTTEACEIPTNVEVFNVSSNSVTLNWNAKGQEVWEIEYGLENFELGTGTVLFTETIPSTIENLSASTRYDIYIRANCGPNGRSEYVGPILVETLL